MRYLIAITIFYVFQSCSHSNSRSAASADNVTCGLYGTLEERIASCIEFQNNLSFKDFLVVSKMPDYPHKGRVGFQTYLYDKNFIYQDKSTNRLWTSPVLFQGTVEQAIEVCASRSDLDRQWSLPVHEDIVSIFNRLENPAPILERILGSKRNEMTSMIKYYDYQLKNNTLAQLQFKSESVILCISRN